MVPLLMIYLLGTFPPAVLWQLLASRVSPCSLFPPLFALVCQQSIESRASVV